MNDLVKIARARVTDIQQTHWEGCERDHRECLIQRMADEIERLTAENEKLRLALEVQPGPVNMEDVEWAGKTHLIAALRDRYELRRQLAEMRAALVAAMEIVRNRREIISQQNQQVPEIWQAADKLDAVIAQADAAMGLTRPAEE